MPLADEPTPGREVRDPDEQDEVPAARAPEATGRGRVVPQTNRPVRDSGASGRQQPTRSTKSKRGKK